MWLLVIFILNLLLSFRLFFEKSWRLSFAISLQAFALLSFIYVEVLGFFNLIGYSSAFIYWGVLCLLTIIYNFSRRGNLPKFNLNLNNFYKNKIVLVTFFFFIITFLSGVFYAPNTIDSLVYHLTRVEFWIQHKNINYFATQTDRMLYQPPLAEYMILQFRLLADADNFSFIIQWLYAIGACGVVSLLVSFVRNDLKVQYLAFFIAGSIPMLLLQSSSTQNDVVVSFFILMTIYWVFNNVKLNDNASALLIGISIGESILTKGTAYIFLFPICLYWGVAKLMKIYNKELEFWSQMRLFIFIFMPFLVICGTFYFRNYTLVGSPLGVSKELFFVYNNQSHDVGSIFSLIIRNISLHFSVPGFHFLAEKIVVFIHENLLNVNVNDSATSFTPFDLPMFGLTEDNAGNFLHILLFIPAIRYSFKSKNRNLIVLTLFAIISFLLFCFQVKWQIWHSRLHIPIFLVMSVPISIWLKEQRFSKYIITLIGLSSLFYSVFCFARPVIKLPPITSNVYFTSHKIDHFFYMEPHKAKQYCDVIEYLKSHNIKRIGVRSEEKYGNDILYPIMFELRSKAVFIPIQMSNLTKVLDKNEGNFDAVLSFTMSPKDTLKVDKNYRKLSVNAENLYIFVP